MIVTKRNGYTLTDKKGRYKDMTDQQIFDILSDHEEKLFYALCNDKGNEPLKAA